MGRCARRTSGVRRSKKLPADQNQLREAVKDNRSFFLCLFRALKAQPTNFCLFVKSSQTRPVECCSDSSILNSQSKTPFFVLRPPSFFSLGPSQACFLA